MRSAAIARVTTGAILVLCCGVAAAQETAPSVIPAPGRLVDAGGHLLHLNCTGSGTPTVILEGAAGEFSLAWALVQPKVSAFTRVCSYDRAGYAWSDPGPQPRTMAQISFELHTALAHAREPGPYVLAGASFGGAIARVFTRTYPGDVSGLVLVDSTHENGFIFLNETPVRLRETAKKREIPPVQTSSKPSERTGEPLAVVPTRSKTFLKEDARSNLLPDLQRIWLVAAKQPKYNEARNGEFQFLAEELSKLYEETTANPHPLGDRPLIVLTRDVEYDRAPEGVSVAMLEEDRKTLQGQLAALSTKGKLVIAKDSGREIHLSQPDVVVTAIRDVVQAVRASAPAKEKSE